MKRNRIVLFAGKQTTRHHIHCFRILTERFGWSITLITVYPDVADSARDILSVDKVYLVKSFVLPFLQENPALMDIIMSSHPDMCIVLGSGDNRFQSFLAQTQLPIIWIREVGYDPEEKLYSLRVKKEIRPGIIPQVSQKQSIVYVPAPMVDYQDFLDLNTDLVLEWKNDCGLISHDTTQNTIHKKMVVAVLGTSEQEYAIQSLLENQDILMYSIAHPDSSDIAFPELHEDNAPILYELCDALIVVEDTHHLVQLSLMRAMASGTVIITPRTELYTSALGRGSLYYEEYSLPEIQACLEILHRSEHKRQEVRSAASLMFEKRYSYSAISRLWHTVLEYSTH